MNLVHNWKTWPKRWSVQLGIVGATLTGWLIAAPDAAKAAWLMMPDDLRIAIPSKLTPLIGVVLFALSMLAQLIRQRKLNPPDGDLKIDVQESKNV